VDIRNLLIRVVGNQEKSQFRELISICENALKILKKNKAPNDVNLLFSKIEVLFKLNSITRELYEGVWSLFDRSESDKKGVVALEFSR